MADIEALYVVADEAWCEVLRGPKNRSRAQIREEVTRAIIQAILPALGFEKDGEAYCPADDWREQVEAALESREHTMDPDTGEPCECEECGEIRAALHALRGGAR